MTLKNVKPSLDKISKSLAGVQDNREFLLKNSREIIILCSRSIISVHKGDLKTAKKNLQEVDSLLKKYRKKATSDLRRYLITSEQEYVEAAWLLAVVEGKEIPSDKKLKVMAESYVLGLLDCVGELKRMVFDKIRIGDTEKALKTFDIMENLTSLWRCSIEYIYFGNSDLVWSVEPDLSLIERPMCSHSMFPAPRVCCTETWLTVCCAVVRMNRCNRKDSST